MRNSLLTGLVAFGLSAQGASAEDERAAWIESNESADAITLHVHARLDHGESGRYKLTVRKIGPSGTSTTRQAGRIPTGDGQTDSGPLMKTRQSFRDGDTLEAELIVDTSADRKIRDIVRLAAKP